LTDNWDRFARDLFVSQQFTCKFHLTEIYCNLKMVRKWTHNEETKKRKNKFQNNDYLILCYVSFMFFSAAIKTVSVQINNFPYFYHSPEIGYLRKPEGRLYI